MWPTNQPSSDFYKHSLNFVCKGYNNISKDIHSFGETASIDLFTLLNLKTKQTTGAVQQTTLLKAGNINNLAFSLYWITEKVRNSTQRTEIAFGDSPDITL